MRLNNEATREIENLEKYGRYEEAITLWENLITKTNDPDTLSNAYAWMGKDYYNTKAYSAAIKITKKALKIFEAKELSMRTIVFGQELSEQLKTEYNWIIYRMGICHKTIGLSLMNIDEDEKAEQHILEAIDLYKNIDNKTELAFSYSKLAKLYFKKKEFNLNFKFKVKALACFKAACKEKKKGESITDLLRALASESDFLAHFIFKNKKGQLPSEKFLDDYIKNLKKYVENCKEPIDPIVLDELELFSMLSDNPDELKTYLRLSSFFSFFAWYEDVNENLRQKYNIGKKLTRGEIDTLKKFEYIGFLLGKTESDVAKLADKRAIIKMTGRTDLIDFIHEEHSKLKKLMHDFGIET